MAMMERLVNVLRGDPYRDPWKLYEYSHVAGTLEPELAGAEVVADFGCGEGLLTTLLAERAPHARVIGVDERPGDDWSRHPAVEFHVADAGGLPLGPRCADVVVAKDLLHHMDDPRRGVAALIASARSRVVIVEANLDNPIMALYTRHNGDAHMRRSELEMMLQQVAPESVSWRFAPLTAYPFYLPPVRSAAAIWVWPTTLAMLVAFKLLRSRRLASALHGFMIRRRWSPPFTVAVAEVTA